MTEREAWVLLQQAKQARDKAGLRLLSVIALHGRDSAWYTCYRLMWAEQVHIASECTKVWNKLHHEQVMADIDAHR